MTKPSALIPVLAISLAMLLCLVSSGNCQFPAPPPMVTPLPLPGGPPAQPLYLGPCQPVQQCSTFSIEGGGRAFYTRNWFKLTQGTDPDINFVKDLNFSENTLVGEIFGAVRIVPSLAATYTFMLPREDHGYGVLPADLTVNGTLFPAGTHVTAKTTISLHRFEGEYFAVVGPNYRGGVYLLGELWFNQFSMTSDITSDSKIRNEFLMGIGGSGEFAPSRGTFVKIKAAYTFLEKQNGVFLDGQAKLFPDLNGGPGSGFRPYVAAGYRYRSSQWDLNENTKLQASIYGPYAEVGVIF